MATNQIKPFATGSSANVATQAAYEAADSTLNGFSSGVAPSNQVNKAIRQSSFIAAAVAQFTADKSAQDVLDDGDTTSFITKFTSAIQSAFGMVSINNMPTQNVGPVIVIEAAEMWLWSTSAYFTGYRSPLCGSPLDGHTVTPLISEVDAVGGTLSKTAYSGLWGYAQENGLVVASASWVAGTHKFVDLGGDNFRVPDLRNQFRRYAGTDADTANARVLGSAQIDTFATHSHTLSGAQNTSQGTCNVSWMGNGSSMVKSTAGTGGAETRPVNTAFHPRIHV